MHQHNRPIADAFADIADLLEVRRADPSRVRAFRSASLAVQALPESVRGMVRRGIALGPLTGIGDPLTRCATELAEHGSCAVLDRLRLESEHDFSELLALPQLGPRRVRTLFEELGISTLEALHDAALAGRLQPLAGFGPRLEQLLLKTLAKHRSRVRRLRRDQALPAARGLCAWVRELPAVKRVEWTGSLRRGCDSLADLNLIAESETAREVVAAFSNHPEVRETPFAGRARTGVVFNDGLLVTLQVSDAKSFGAAWLSTTGSRAHLEGLLHEARKRHMTLDETGLRQGVTGLASGAEADIYCQLGLAFIPPELREGRGEIEASAAGELPALISARDLVGDLHVGLRCGADETPLEDLVASARARGLRYVAVADPARRQHPARMNDLDRFARQLDRIDELNAGATDFVILKGIHADILDDGHLNLPDALLARADLVVATLQHPFDLSRTRQTERLLRAMDNRFFSILGAPTGRLIEKRPPANLDLVRVLRKARERGCFVELDSRPEHLDLDDTGCRQAKAAGVLVCVDSCGSGARSFDMLDYGVTQARRAWLACVDVLNTRPVAEVLALLAGTMQR